jgi:hypothetical protein
MEQWVYDKVAELKKFTDRPIVVRCHPRSFLNFNNTQFKIEMPKKIPNTYDDFDIDYNYHCVINHNSGPCVQAAIHGTPVICDQSSLAFDISDDIKNIENVSLPDREEWFVKLAHTEWTLEEISRGVPLKRLESFLKS